MEGPVTTASPLDAASEGRSTGGASGTPRRIVVAASCVEGGTHTSADRARTRGWLDGVERGTVRRSQGRVLPRYRVRRFGAA